MSGEGEEESNERSNRHDEESWEEVTGDRPRASRAYQRMKSIIVICDW